jgi:intraflagellar transport protein 140
MQLQWWHGRGMLAVVTEDDTVLLTETLMNSLASSELQIVQKSINEVLVFSGTAEPKLVNTGIQIRGLALSHTCFVVWSGKVAKVVRIDPPSLRLNVLDPIKCSGMACAIADSSSIIEEALFIAEGSVLKILNFTGTQKGVVSFTESEGTPILVDLNGKFLVAATSKGFLKVIDVHTPTKPKQLGSSFQLFQNTSVTVATKHITESNSKIRMIRINSNGTMVAILLNKVGGAQEIHYPDDKLYVFDRNRGTVFTHDFSEASRSPSVAFWDEVDDRLLACETCKNQQSPKGETDDKNLVEGEKKSATEVSTFFVTTEHGILIQDTIPNSDNINCSLMGLNAPKIYFRKKVSILGGNEDTSPTDLLFSKTLRDFVGINQITDSIKSSLLDFSFFLTLGKLDEAYRVVKEIDSPLVWENMAQMCVKTKRLDVAEVCLGNMGHARGAAAVRESKSENSLEVSIGVLAIQLGLLDDAAKMFKDASRFDLLNQLYQSAGLWEKAISVAESKDRIHLKSTHYQYAKYLENLGRVEDAMEHFQFSDTARTEVPRMLFHLGRIEDLNEYVMQTDDPILLKWWASYLESIDRLDKAKKYYNKAKDYLSLVRIYCFQVFSFEKSFVHYYFVLPFSFLQGDFQKAVDIITESGDRASAYHFARQMENQGEYQEAIRFYALSGCYNHSIRLARAHNLDSELMRFAVKSTQALMIECAQHFEIKGEFDKAIQLYHKGGDIPRALELCFRIGEEPKNPQAAVAFDMLNTIAQDLGADSSPQTLARCADFLVQHKQYSKAVELYVMAKRYLAAIDMCTLNRVSLNEEMVEALTPNDSMDSVERKEILKALGKALKKQGAFTLASKKYTQAGDRVRAIKCLVRGGDTKAVIQFANISRNNEIYTLAANYLQQMNWRENVEIMKAIIMFYTKAKAFIQLAGFYDGCAQVEIDEYRDYEKALGAYNEAIKCLAKDSNRTAKDMLEMYERKVLIVEKFLEAKNQKNNANLTITICEALLQDPNVEEAIRIGDCLSLLIETLHNKGNYAEAYHYLKELQDRFDVIYSYIDEKTENTILKAVGAAKPKAEVKSRQEEKKLEISRDDEDEIEEEIDEVIITLYFFLLNFELVLFRIFTDMTKNHQVEISGKNGDHSPLIRAVVQHFQNLS